MDIRMLMPGAALALSACAEPADPAPEELATATAPSAVRPPPGVPLALDSSPLAAGQRVVLEARSADPGETVHFFRASGPGPGPCAPTGACLDIAGAVAHAGTAVADGAGVARLSVTLPAALAAGTPIAVQAVAPRGPAGADSVKSAALVGSVVAALPWDLTNNGTCLLSDHVRPLYPSEIGHWAAERFQPPGPYLADAVQYTLYQSGSCQGDVPHRVRVWTQSSSTPDAAPVIRDEIFVPGTPSFGVRVPYTVPLTRPLEVGPSEQLFVAVEMAESGVGVEYVCLSSCAEDTTPLANWWSNATAAPYPWAELQSWGIAGDYEIGVLGSAPAAGVEVDCADGIDNDGDGLVDCADPSCGCAELTCDDGADDDGDLLVDCADPDCDYTAPCITCPAGDLGSALGGGLVVALSDGSWSDDHLLSCELFSGRADTSYRWTAPYTGTFRMSTAESDELHAVAVYDGCGGAELGCSQDAWVDVALTAGQEVVVAVQSLIFTSGPFELGIYDSEGSCVDGVDGNGNGLVDCADPSCECHEASCSDGVDDDADGLADCADVDCALDAACPGACMPVEADLGSSLGTVVQWSLNGGDELLTPSCATSHWQMAYTWTAPADAEYSFDTLGSDVRDTVLQIADPCGATELACSDDISAVEERSHVAGFVPGGATIGVVVGGKGFTVGAFALNIHPRELDCGNGVDDNGNGLVDCADPGCGCP